jgi:hypothetical protein
LFLPSQKFFTVAGPQDFVRGIHRLLALSVTSPSAVQRLLAVFKYHAYALLQGSMVPGLNLLFKTEDAMENALEGATESVQDKFNDVCTSLLTAIGESGPDVSSEEATVETFKIPEDATFRTTQEGLADYITKRDEKHKSGVNEVGKPFFGLRFCQNTKPGAGDGSGLPLWLCPDCYPPAAPDLWSGDPLIAECSYSVKLKKKWWADSDPQWMRDILWTDTETGYSFALPEHERTEGQGQQIVPMEQKDPLVKIEIKRPSTGSAQFGCGIHTSKPGELAQVVTINSIVPGGLADQAGLWIGDEVAVVNEVATAPSEGMMHAQKGMTHDQIVQKFRDFTSGKISTLVLIIPRTIASPAHAEGIRKGDAILEVNGVDAKAMNRSDIIAAIQASPDGHVTLRVSRSTNK